MLLDHAEDFCLV